LFLNFESRSFESVIAMIRCGKIAKKLALLERRSRDLCLEIFGNTGVSAIKKLFCGLLDKKFFAAGPSYVSIAVTNQCNYHCPYCFSYLPYQMSGENKEQERIKYSNAFVSMEIFQKLICDLWELNPKAVIFFNYSGNIMIGEPFLHPDLIKMCAYAQSKGFDFSVLSNGSLVSAEQAKALIDLKVRNVCISLNASSPQVHAKITQASPESYGKVVEMLKLLIKRRNESCSPKTQIAVSQVICSLNYHEVLSFAKLGLELGVDEVIYRKLAFCRRSKQLVGRLLLDDRQRTDLKRLLSEVVLMEKADSRLRTNANSFLHAVLRGELNRPMDYYRNSRDLLEHAVIMGNGAVYAMDHSDVMGNLNENSFADIWYSNHYRSLRRNAGNFDGELFPCYPYCNGCGEALRKLQK